MTTTSNSFRAICIGLAVTITAPTVSLVYAAPSAADMESARNLYKQGKELRDKGDIAGARDKFKAAHALGQTPITGVELGKTHMLLGELVEAREAFLSVGRIPVASDETSKSADARIECNKLAGELKSRIPTLRVILTGVPAGSSAKVTVDNEEIPSAALSEPRAVNPGHHTIVAKVGSNPESRSEIDLKESESRDVTLAINVTMKPEEKRPDGTPPPGPGPGPSPGPTTPPPPIVDHPSGGGGTSPLVYIGFVAAGVGVIAGSITGAMAFGKASEVKQQCPNSTCPTDKSALLEDTKTYATISTISFAVAGGGIVLGIIGLTKKPSNDSAYVKPYFGLGSVGLTGAF
jgi:hypothetical protein